MRKILFPAFLLLASTAHATLYNWTGSWDSMGNTSESGIASGTFDVNPDGSLKLATLSFDNIAWSGFRSQFNTITPTAGNTRMYVADCLVNDGKEGGEYSFWNQVDNPENGTWWLGFGNNAASGKILSFSPDTANDTAPTPEPSSFILMASALTALALFRRKRVQLPGKPEKQS